MAKKKRTFISFDWALKHLLREKANHDVLEGFVSTVLGIDVKIQRLLESEGNKDREDAKYNRVDLLAEDSKGDLLLIEVQGEPEFAYFQRMLFGASKLVTEYINSGENYEHVKRVYSINIVYFDLGQGQDCVYMGKTEFHGLNKGDLLKLTPFQQQKFKAEEVSELYPCYVILKVNDFNRWSRVPLEQWLYFLATTDIPEDADAPGLREAREKLDRMNMGRDEGILYDRYLMDRAILRNQMVTARGEGYIEGLDKGWAEGEAKGRAEGEAKGRAEGEAKGRADAARKMKADRLPFDTIAKYTGLAVEEIEAL
jgi:predicted transposase/invertase (TIGR01784 family)